MSWPKQPKYGKTAVKLATTQLDITQLKSRGSGPSKKKLHEMKSRGQSSDSSSGHNMKQLKFANNTSLQLQGLGSKGG